ncbi:hypothetical protein C8F01DRAFT_1160635 [Mycena amicta]|nr:hypothetical protein C8F01DRAFT_1160635 [Mycena amicta]
MTSTAVLRARIALFDRGISFHKRSLAALETTRNALQSELERIAVYPVLTLPAEITSEIFLHCLPDSERIVANRHQVPLLLLAVCKTWARVARCTAALWRSLVLDIDQWADEDLVGLVKMWFALCVGRPLNIYLIGNLSKLDFGPFMVIFASNTASVSLLRVEISTLRVILSHPRRMQWDQLHEVEIAEDEDSDEDEASLPIDPIDLSGLVSLAPQLRKVDLGLLHPSAINTRHAQLTHFRAFHYSFSKLFETLRLFPNLVELDLELVPEEEHDDPIENNVTHRRLERLLITGYDSEVDLLDFLTLPRLTGLLAFSVDETALANFLQRSGYPPLEQLKFWAGDYPQFFTVVSCGLDHLTELEIQAPPYQLADTVLTRIANDDTFLPALEKLHLECRFIGIVDATVTATCNALVVRSAGAVMERNAKSRQQGTVRSLRALRIVAFATALMTMKIPDKILVEYRKLKESGVAVHIGTPAESCV